MRSVNCLRQNEKKTKKQPAFIKKPNSPIVPYSRWHGIQIEKDGERYLFEMNINDHPMSGGEVRLGHVKIADKAKDEWVEMPRAFLEECRADAGLMRILNERVDRIEELRLLDDVASDADGAYREAEPEVFEE